MAEMSVLPLNPEEGVQGVIIEGLLFKCGPQEFPRYTVQFLAESHIVPLLLTFARQARCANVGVPVEQGVTLLSQGAKKMVAQGYLQVIRVGEADYWAMTPKLLNLLAHHERTSMEHRLGGGP